MLVTTACFGGSQEDMTNSSAAAKDVLNAAIEVMPSTAERRLNEITLHPPFGGLPQSAGGYLRRAVLISMEGL